MFETRFLKSGLALAAVVAMSLPMAAQAAITQDIVVSPNAATIPTLSTQTSDAVLFRVINPSASSVTFTIPSLSVSYDVPAASERTFYMDMSQVIGRQVAYSVLGPNGERLASGTIENTDYLAYSDQNTVVLNELINYSTAYSADIDPEPRYDTRERPVSYPSAEPVRGYW